MGGGGRVSRPEFLTEDGDFNMEKKQLRSNLLLVLTALIWGAAFVAQSVGMDYVGPFTFNAARFMIGGAVLIPCIFLLKKVGNEDQTRSKEEIEARRKTGFIGGFCCGLAIWAGATLQQFGVAQTTVGKAGFITALYIVIVPVLGLFVKKKVQASVWFSIVLATFGMYLLCMGEGLSISIGDALVFLCAIGFSIHILVIDYFSPKADGVLISCIQFFTAGVISLILALLFEEPTFQALKTAWAPILYAGVLSCGVAYTLQVVAQKDTDPVIASLLLSLESVFSLLAGWVILGQVLSPKELFGCVLVFAAIILAQIPVEELVKRAKGRK